VASFVCVATASSGTGCRVTRINKKKEVFFIISSEPKSTDLCMAYRCKSNKLLPEFYKAMISVKNRKKIE
jgi:hypothetical protein